MKTIFDFFISFAKIGLFMFGGGISMLPLLQKEVVEKKHWATEEELSDYYALGQCTPGIIAVNTATFIGTKHAGLLGAISATLGLCFPALIIIGIIAAFLQNFADLPVVIHAFAGIRAGVVALILHSIIKLAKKNITDLFSLVIALIALAVILILNTSPVIIVIAAGIVGVLWQVIRSRSAKEDEEK